MTIYNFSSGVTLVGEGELNGYVKGLEAVRNQLEPVDVQQEQLDVWIGEAKQCQVVNGPDTRAAAPGAECKGIEGPAHEDKAKAAA